MIESGAFIYDPELHATYGDAALMLIDALDRDPRTQRGQPGKPPEARDRAVVEEIIKARGL